MYYLTNFNIIDKNTRVWAGGRARLHLYIIRPIVYWIIANTFIAFTNYSMPFSYYLLIFFTLGLEAKIVLISHIDVRYAETAYNGLQCHEMPSNWTWNYGKPVFTKKAKVSMLQLVAGKQGFTDTHFGAKFVVKRRLACPRSRERGQTRNEDAPGIRWWMSNWGWVCHGSSMLGVNSEDTKKRWGRVWCDLWTEMSE